LRVHLTSGPTHSKRGVFALPSSAVLKPAQAGLDFFKCIPLPLKLFLFRYFLKLVVKMENLKGYFLKKIFIVEFISF
jgi:hypothetical protein